MLSSLSGRIQPPVTVKDNQVYLTYVQAIMLTYFAIQAFPRHVTVQRLELMHIFDNKALCLYNVRLCMYSMCLCVSVCMYLCGWVGGAGPYLTSFRRDSDF